MDVGTGMSFSAGELMHGIVGTGRSFSAGELMDCNCIVGTGSSFSAGGLMGTGMSFRSFSSGRLLDDIVGFILVELTNVGEDNGSSAAAEAGEDRAELACDTARTWLRRGKNDRPGALAKQTQYNYSGNLSPNSRRFLQQQRC